MAKIRQMVFYFVKDCQDVKIKKPMGCIAMGQSG